MNTTQYPTRTEIRTYEENGETKTYEVQIITVPVTIRGETREVEFRTGPTDTAHSSQVFGCYKGNGTKVHRTRGSIVYKNGEWVFTNIGYALNQQCRISEWADKVPAFAKSQHNGTKIDREVK